ncbi:hypothetical protein V0242_18680 [Aeromonas hydrophila]|uniref:hypothetical protein n=1 Tax=Aeromonas hydrophila TaxID=644 RepID=UPI002ED44B08|nr:hypothetical protein V0242_18680 [Aeromonas hydrophila]
MEYHNEEPKLNTEELVDCIMEANDRETAIAIVELLDSMFDSRDRYAYDLKQQVKQLHEQICHLRQREASTSREKKKREIFARITK